MKNLYLIGGTMGVGKTAVCQQLKKDLPNSVFLDGDWCWDENPFQITEETKNMVINNICYLLNNFLHCSAYKNIIFCWVLHEQFIIDSIIERLEVKNCVIKCISLIADRKNIKNRLKKDISNGIRTVDVIDRSIAKISLYQDLNTIKVDTNEKTITMISKELKEL